jgi:hypothetical protein
VADGSEARTGGAGRRDGAVSWGKMKVKKPTAGERMIESARQALAFARGEKDHGCVVHVPDEIDVKAIREKMAAGYPAVRRAPF